MAKLLLAKSEGGWLWSKFEEPAPGAQSDVASQGQRQLTISAALCGHGDFITVHRALGRGASQMAELLPLSPEWSQQTKGGQG
jgi:hypothetical protein